MKLTLRMTSTIDTIGREIPARIWEGETESGTPVKAWIAIVEPQTDDADKLAEFEREMKEMPAKREMVSFDIRMVI